MMSRLALLLGLPLASRSNQVDIIMEAYHPPAACAYGCAAWTTAPAQGEGWNALAAGKSCAIPGAVTGKNNSITHAWGGPFCYCADAPGAATACVPFRASAPRPACRTFPSMPIARFHRCFQH